MSESFSGLITKVRKDRKGFFIDGNWYSVYASSEMDGVNKGDTVSFTFVRKGDWNNIDNGTIKKEASAPAASGGSSSGGGGGSYNSQFRTVPELNRIDGLRFAVESVGSTGDLKTNVQQTLKIAAVYTAFIEGNLPGAGTASTPSGGDADAAAKAAAEATAAEEAEKARVAAEEAAAKQQAAGASALDDFLGG